jgi:ABC-type nitrate/sulfonate/bicarbonate transport system substrate-binding protein
MTALTLGFIPLTDCAPLVVALDQGFFADEGLEVSLSREASWASIRDKVAVGALDGAHMLGPMPLAASLDTASVAAPPTIVPMALNSGGSAITVSTALAAALAAIDAEGMAASPRTARPMHRLIKDRASRGESPLTFAVVFPYSVHNYQLRYWLAEAGIDPDRDVRIVVVPPPRMAERLKSGEIDGFCVGAPWNALSVLEGAGEILIRSSQFWSGAPDKVFGVGAAWAEREPDRLQAVLRALLRASVWADASENRPELASLLAAPQFVGVSEAAIAASLDQPGGGPTVDHIAFHRNAASFPWRSHAVWFLSQMQRWGQIGADVDVQALARTVYRPDIYRQAAASLALPSPLIDEKIEGAHDHPWTLDAATGAILMTADVFFDGKRFDPAQPLAYAESFAVKRSNPPEF